VVKYGNVKKLAGGDQIIPGSSNSLSGVKSLENLEQLL
jgi:hypothetical protein